MIVCAFLFFSYLCRMTPWFYIKVKVGKFVANLAAVFVTDRNRRHQLRSKLDPLNPQRCVAYLEQHYTQVDALPPSPPSSPCLDAPVWVCWLQGREQAPQLVQDCIRSIEQHTEGRPFVVLTAANFAQYVDLPPYVVEKWQKSKITNTHFSDILRIHALARHGGCWIDATCLLTAPIPAEILDSPFFLYRTHGEFSYTFIQSCFIVSKPAQYIVRKWCAAIDAYWQHENFLINYFTLHLLFIALLHRDEQFAAAFAKVTVATDEPMHALFYALKAGQKPSAELMDQVSRDSFIHKLTYKIPLSLNG